jgi:hypothetical protein
MLQDNPSNPGKQREPATVNIHPKWLQYCFCDKLHVFTSKMLCTSIHIRTHLSFDFTTQSAQEHMVLIS